MTIAERIKTGWQTDISIPQWCFQAIGWLSIVDHFWPIKNLAGVFLLFLFLGNSVNTRKKEKLSKITTGLLLAGEFMFWFFIVGSIALSLFGDQIDRWFLSMGL